MILHETCSRHEECEQLLTQAENKIQDLRSTVIKLESTIEVKGELHSLIHAFNVHLKTLSNDIECLRTLLDIYVENFRAGNYTSDLNKIIKAAKMDILFLTNMENELRTKGMH